MTQRLYKDAYIAFFVSLTLQLGYVIFYPQLALKSDAVAYDQVGLNLTVGKGFVGGFAGSFNLTSGYSRPGDPLDGGPEIGIGPVYPVYLSLLHRVFGHTYLPVRISQAFLSALVIMCVYYLGREAFDLKTTRLALYLSAVYPGYPPYAGMIITEILTMTLVGISMVCVMIAYRRDSIAWTVLAGITFSILILQRSEFLLLPPIISLLWWRDSTWSIKGVVKPALLVAVTIFAISPWTWRNYTIFHEVIPVSANFGQTLYLAGSPDEPMEWDYQKEPLRSMIPGLSYVEANHVLGRLGWRSIKQFPLTYIKNCIKRLIRLWGPSHTWMMAGLQGSTMQYLRNGAVLRFITKISFLGVNVFLVALGFIGIYLVLRSSCIFPVVILAAPIVYKTIVHSALFASQRYIIPVMPLLLLFSSFAAIEIFVKSKGK